MEKAITPEQLARAKEAFIEKVDRYGGRHYNGHVVLIIGEDSIEEALVAALDSIEEKNPTDLIPVIR